MANVEADQLQGDRRESGRPSKDPSTDGQSPGSRSLSDCLNHPPDGAFESFLSSAIVAILTILFSWRMLMLTSTDDPSYGKSPAKSDSQSTGHRADYEEATLPNTEKPLASDIPLCPGKDSSAAKKQRNVESNTSSLSDLTFDNFHLGSVMAMSGQSSVGDGGFSNSSSSCNRSSAFSAGNSPEADVETTDNIIKWAEPTLTPHCNSGELSGAANRYAGNTIISRRRPQQQQIFNADTVPECFYSNDHINIKNGDYLERKGDERAEHASDGEYEGRERFISYSPLGDWDRPLRRTGHTTDTELQRSGEENEIDLVEVESLKHALSRISGHFVRSHSLEINTKEEGQFSDTVATHRQQQMDRYQLVPMPTEEEMDFWGPDEEEQEEVDEKDNGRLSRTGFHDMEPWDPIDYDDGSALEAYFEQDYFDSSEESEDSEFLCERRLETILEEEEEDSNEDQGDISEEEAEEIETDNKEDKEEIYDGSEEEAFTGIPYTRITDEVLPEDVSYFQSPEDLQEDFRQNAELHSEFDQHSNSIRTSYSSSVTDYFSSDSSVKLPKSSDTKKHILTRGRIESHKALSEVRDLFNALVHSNSGIQSGASVKADGKLGFDSVSQDVASPFVSGFRTEAVAHKDSKRRFPLDSSSTTDVFMQVTDLDDLFEGHLLDSTDEVPLSMTLNSPFIVVDTPMPSRQMEPTAGFLVSGDFVQRAMESEDSVGEATGNDESCVEEVEWEDECVPVESEEDEGMWVSEARVFESSETFVCKSVFHGSVAVGDSTSKTPGVGRFNEEDSHFSIKDTSTSSAFSTLSPVFTQTERVRGETNYENICNYDELQEPPDLENESRPSPRAEITVQSMYPHTQNLLKFISSEVISLRRPDADLPSYDEVRLQKPLIENSENQLHWSTGPSPEYDLSMRNWHTQIGIHESQSMVKDFLTQKKPLEQLKDPMTSTCIMSEPAESKDLISLTDYDQLPTNGVNYFTKKFETETEKLEKTSIAPNSEDFSVKTENQKESAMGPCSEILSTDMPFNSYYSGRKLKLAKAAVNDLSKRRMGSPKPSRKVFSVIDIDLDADPSVSRVPRTNFEELKQKLASVRLRAPPSPIPDELWNTADEILARHRSRDRGLNKLGSDAASDTVDSALRRAKSLSLLPNSYRAVKKFEPVGNRPANKSVTSSYALTDQSSSSPSTDDDDRFAKSQSLSDLRNSARLSIFSGNGLMNQDKGLSKSEQRLFESLQQLDIPDWFQNSARKQQEIVILKHARSIERILSDCTFSPVQYPHKFDTKEPVVPKPVVIAHYVKIPTYENKQTTNPSSVVTNFELPSSKLRERSHSPFHPIKTRSFEEIMKLSIRRQSANDESMDEIEKIGSENLAQKDELSRKHNVDKSKTLSDEGTKMCFVPQMLPEQNTPPEMDPKSVGKINTRPNQEELLSVAQQHSSWKDNEVHSYDKSEEKHNGSIRISSPIPSDETLPSLGLTRKKERTHEERYPPSVAETQLLRRNSLKKSNLTFSEEKYPFSAAQKYIVMDQVSSDSEGTTLGRAESELNSLMKDSEKHKNKTKKLTKKSQNSELLSGEKKKKKIKNSSDLSSSLEKKELDGADGMTWQVEQIQEFEGQVGKMEDEDVTREGKRRVKKKKSPRTDELEGATERKVLVTDRSTGVVLREEINELLTYERHHEQEDSKGQIKRPRRKRSELQGSNGLKDVENSNQTLTSCIDVDFGNAVHEQNCFIMDDVQKVQADEHSYNSLGKAVKLKKTKSTKISERELETTEFFENQGSVMHEVADNIQMKKSHKKKKSKELPELDVFNERFQGVTKPGQLDAITSQEASTDESFAGQLKKPLRSMKAKFQEEGETDVRIMNISQFTENNDALEATDTTASVDNKVRVSRKKVKSSSKKDLYLSKEPNVWNATDNKEFIETSSLESNEMTNRTASDFQVSEAESKKSLKKVKRKKVLETDEINGDGIVRLNWETSNNNPSTGTNVLTDELRKSEEERLLNGSRVGRKTKKVRSIEDMQAESASAKPKKKLNEENASVISDDSIKVRKRLKNSSVSEITNSDQALNVGDCSTGDRDSAYYMEQVDRLQMTHSSECSVSQDNLSENQANILSHASSFVVGQPKKTKKQRVTDSAANETENGFVQSKTLQPSQSHSPHQVRAVQKARTLAAAALYSPQSDQRTGYRAVDRLFEYEQQQF